MGGKDLLGDGETAAKRSRLADDDFVVVVNIIFVVEHSNCW